MEGKIHGVKAARAAPAISHLFFADDTILFTRACEREVTEIKKIIKKYETSSGQLINLEKTEMTVSPNVSEEKKSALKNILGVNVVDRHKKYLGLPTVIGKSKKQVFQIVVNNVIKKLKNWQESILSQAGKEVLVKSVIQAIPSYYMTYFLLPFSTCQDIKKATARFFWGSTQEERKMHGASWKKLTTRKHQGGLGFREIHYFNVALLAKQIWNLLNNQNSIPFQILKAKYFPRESILNAKIGYKPNYLWRSLHAAMELVKDGEAWCVGDGRNIHIRDDRWIGTEGQTKPTAILNPDLNYARVCELMNPQGTGWNINLIVTPRHPL